MPGNSFGQSFRVTTFGESHGIAIGGIIDGCPPGLELSESDIQPDLDRRKPGGKHATQRAESDTVQILSGVFEGRTTGTPIALVIYNADQKSKDYNNVKSLFRPGHADFTYQQKYGIRDYRGGGRSSARETAIRVAAGAVAKKILAQNFNTRIRAAITVIGEIEVPLKLWDETESNPFFITDADMVATLDQYLTQIKKEHDSVGGKVELQIENPPVGIGEPVFDRLDADLAHALMGINAVKGVEIGLGFASAAMKGSQFRDEMTPEGFKSNNAGGILGGISSGQHITARVAFKPTPSIAVEGDTVDIDNNPVKVVTKGRHDPCVAIRGVPVVEAMAALVLADHYLRDRAQTGSPQRTAF